MKEKEMYEPNIAEEETDAPVCTEEGMATEGQEETVQPDKKTEKREKKQEEKRSRELQKQLDAAEQRIHAAEKQFTELSDSHLRLKADFDNYKKRNQMAVSDAYTDGIAYALTEFLKVMDNMERALAAAKEAGNDAIADGIQLSMDSFMRSFEKNELKKIESDGVEFDPNLHNAVMQQPTDEEEKRGTVAQTFQTGYVMGKRVLRHSVVSVYV